jgi:oligopeptide transport system substrate-binding protein
LNWETLAVRVEAVIEQRIGRLDRTLRDILGAGSEEGEEFSAQVVGRVLGLDERLVLRQLAQELARRHGLVCERGEIQAGRQRLTRYQFGHVLFQQYLYATLGAGEWRLLHGEIAALLEEWCQEDTDPFNIQLAHYYAEAGDQARDLYAHQAAIDHYREAIRLLKVSGDNEGAARALMKLGLAYHNAFAFERSHQAYEEGFALWPGAGGQLLADLPRAPHALRLIWQDPVSLDPTMGGTSLQAPIVTQLFSGLLAQSPEMEVVPDVAHRWEVLDNGRKYIFHLREDVYWSDGIRVTAADFEYSFKRALDPASKAPVAGMLLDSLKGAQDFNRGRSPDSGQLGISAPDDTTFILELEEPTSYFLQNLAYYVLLPVPRHVVAAHGQAWATAEHIVTNGPFRLAAWERGKFMSLERNPRYHGQFTGNVQRVNLILSANGQAAFELYAADQIDVLYNWFFLGADLEPLKRQYASDYNYRPRFGTFFLLFDIKRPPFDDLRTRRAFTLAIDRETLAKAICKGYEFPGTGGFIPPGMPGYSAGIGLPFDPTQAQRYLAEAGYPGGEKFPRVNLLAYPLRQALVEHLQTQWRERLNVSVEIDYVKTPTVYEQIQQEQPSMAVGAWLADYADPDNYLRVCVKLDTPEWHNETYERLLDQARQTTDQAERMQVYQQADRLLMEEAIIIPLTYSQTHLFTKPWVRNFLIPAIKNPGFWKDVIIEPH